MSFEGLLTELLVASVLDGVHFESVGVAVDVVGLREQVRDWVHGGDDAAEEVDDHLGVWNLVSSDEGQELTDVVGHLWHGRRSSIVVLDHTVVQLGRHGNDHVVEVWVEISSLWHVESEWWVVVVTGHHVVRVVDQTWLMGVDLGQIGRPHTVVGSLGLVDGEVWGPHSVIDHSLSEVPLLEEVSLVLLSGRVDFGGVDHFVHELSLGETLVHQQIVLTVDGTVTSLNRSGY